MAPKIHLIILMHACSILLVTSNSTLNIPKFSSILVFGDSLVDTGNNNYIKTLGKANHLPYGRDFPDHVPTGRLCNGKLVPDFLASILNLKDTLPPYLDPYLSDEEFLTGVSFASAGSGLDELTAASFNVLSLSKQVEYFKAYVAKLKNIAGENETIRILGDALVVICIGSNDFLLNFYNFPYRRRLTFTIDQYQSYLLDKLQIFIKDLYDLGCRNFGVPGLAPLGCTPYQMTVKFRRRQECVEKDNYYADQYNQKLIQLLPQIQAMLPGTKFVYADLYYTVLTLLNQPEKYGFEVTTTACCGLGLLAAGPACNELTPVCSDASKYLYWDVFHFSEVSNRYIANYIETLLPQFNSQQ